MDEGPVQRLVSMGFSCEWVREALQNAGNDVNRAAELLLLRQAGQVVVDLT